MSAAGAYLAALPELAEMPAPALWRLSEMCSVIELAPGQVLIRQHAADPWIHLLSLGRLGAVQELRDGKRIRQHAVDAFTALGSLHGDPRDGAPFTWIALSPSRVLRLHRGEVLALGHRSPEAFAIIGFLSRAIIRASQHAGRAFERLYALPAETLARMDGG